jgi:hypothetical protein
MAKEEVLKFAGEVTEVSPARIFLQWLTNQRMADGLTSLASQSKNLIVLQNIHN